MMKDKILVKVKDLKPGMFVEELDRPWLETPYLLQGILIQKQADIDELAQYCETVYISPKKGSTPENYLKKPFCHIIPEESKEKTIFHGNHVYTDIHTVEEELPAARKAHQTAQVLINQIKYDIDRDFTLNVDAAKELVDVIARSIIKNPSAMLLLNRFKSTKDGQYDRALNTSVYMITFGRHLCLPTDELAILGLGGLLMDVGQLKLLSKASSSNDIFQKNILSEQHVIYGEEILATMPGIPQKVIEITAQHHEREDGTGYPRGLAGSQIAPYARMAAIIDCYERIVSEGINEFSPPLSPFEALKMLWDWTRRWLNATLVQRFAHSIGLFPVGSLVELNSGEVAIVLTHNRSNRLQPQVMIVLDPQKEPYSCPKTLDLGLNKEGPHGAIYQIERDLAPDAYDIDPKNYYL
jgi:HD-GYP domain-containing protein (c-di-GMP phosphodiesterase class II)